MPLREVWRRSPTVPEYEVSDHGRVRRIPHTKPMPGGGVRTYGGQPHCGQWIPGDRRFILTYKGRNYKVARLICEAFNGPPPFEGAVCMHLDENSRNNVPANLAWGTQKQNLNAPGFLEYCRSRTGANNPRIKAMKQDN